MNLNQLVKMELFKLDSTTGDCDKHEMIEIIAISRRIAARELSIRINVSETVPVLGSNENDIDHDLDEYFWIGLRDCPSVNVIKKMGDISNTWFPNKQHMVESGLCTDSQYEYGMIKLVDCMAHVLEHLYVSKHVIVVSDHNKSKNEWDNDEDVVFKFPSAKKAAKQLE